MDLVLKDKIVVYDLAGQRIGWANYDLFVACECHYDHEHGQNRVFYCGSSRQ
ncbi:hypothetical protein OROMI_034463 [Orobanche minor]